MCALGALRRWLRRTLATSETRPFLLAVFPTPNVAMGWSEHHCLKGAEDKYITSISEVSLLITTPRTHSLSTHNVAHPLNPRCLTLSVATDFIQGKIFLCPNSYAQPEGGCETPHLVEGVSKQSPSTRVKPLKPTLCRITLSQNEVKPDRATVFLCLRDG